ncbi:hypothetical protein D3C80_709810 [compost metagenome]
MAAAIVRHDAEAALGEEKHLAVPGIGIQRPAVREGDDRASPPVFIVDFCAVLGGDRAHCLLSVIDGGGERLLWSLCGGNRGQARDDTGSETADQGAAT